ncbi:MULTISPECIES: DUF3800 domain-containing protein [Rhizobium]|uniref:DUF3800 domain-containing protein n=1 Tax=Rhizobium phaseoli TaxID=396 RepID=A0A7X6EZK0_9HYPH|nr:MULTISPECIES: DUF3800 domain-containing protein [Rhizobium]ANL40411.1 hypothetical protein AMC88_CH02021 [Rhizobium phaseoli]ANL59399.1 hypothetical protein AMC85_CH02020 [Rhizobium phaseoli]MDE8762830.1 DUF3800 domain-containing protein [Rhizobium sp. CBK13]NKF10835.1 DUF3800 domain-containing protein [Rhizobium phaseoli]QPK10759.1 DUF3800 domain-containing protein [Rhizobium phaseoli]
MSWHAYIDESYNPERDAYVIGGCIATESQWTEFSAEWQSFTERFGRIDAAKRRYFHMAEMTHRLEEVGFFYSVISRHVPVFISARFNRSEFDRARRRIYIPGATIEWDPANYYWIAFRCLMDKFHLERPQLERSIPLEEVVQFHMDDTYDRKSVERMWEEYILHRPDDIRDRYADAPIFEDDKTVPPLQAADFWVWWVREWIERGTPQRILRHDFVEFAKPAVHQSPRVTIDIEFSEEQFLPTIARMAKRQSGREVIILPPMSA